MRVGYGWPEKIRELPHFHKLSTGRCEQALTELSTGFSTGLSTDVRLTGGPEALKMRTALVRHPVCAFIQVQGSGEMTRVIRDDYEELLEQAGDAAEQEADDNLLDETIAERLAALAGEGQAIGEAEQAAAAAEPPRERSDGQVVGMAEGRARPLTQSQIAFAQGVIEGKSRRQAYRDAYPNANGADSTISASAARLARDPRIKRMIEAGWEETQEALADDIQATRRYVGRALVALSRGGKQENTRLRALELLGKHCGMFKDTVQAQEKPITAEDLRKELAGHLRLVTAAQKKA